MKKVLIALSYNPSAQEVAEVGFDFAKAMKSQTVLLHVSSDAVYYSSLNYSPIMGFVGFGNPYSIEKETQGEIKKMAQTFLNKSKEHLGDNTIETIVKEGDFAETILDTAKELKADVIVIGNHSRHGFDKLMMGSVAEKVLHHSYLPLFIIPTKVAEK
ncbi:MAG: universal stress protein [Bacteroidetes bacterium]|nr:universal stress protein [Bacteroidota bacterium]